MSDKGRSDLGPMIIDSKVSNKLLVILSHRSFNNDAGPSMFCKFEDDESFEEFYNLVCRRLL